MPYKDKELAKKKGRERYLRNREKYLEMAKLRYEANKESVLEMVSKYRDANREDINKKSREYYMDNKDKIKARRKGCIKIKRYNAIRRKKNRDATPNWLKDEDKWLIQEYYELAHIRYELTGIKWEVDHIIPLNGKVVSGLHVPENLRVITEHENRRKYNKYCA